MSGNVGGHVRAVTPFNGCSSFFLSRTARPRENIGLTPVRSILVIYIGLKPRTNSEREREGVRETAREGERSRGIVVGENFIRGG